MTFAELDMTAALCAVLLIALGSAWWRARERFAALHDEEPTQGH